MLCICVCVCLQMLTFETLLVKELQKQQSRAEFCDIVLQTRGLTKYIFSLIFFSHLSLRLLYFLHPVQACLCRCTAVCCLPSVLGSVGLCQPCHHPETDRGDWLKSKQWRPVRCSVWSVCCTRVSWTRTKRMSYQQPANSALTYLSKYQRGQELNETHRRSAWKRWRRESVKPRLFLLNVKTPKRPLKVLIWCTPMALTSPWPLFKTSRGTQRTCLPFKSWMWSPKVQCIPQRVDRPACPRSTYVLFQLHTNSLQPLCHLNLTLLIVQMLSHWPERVSQLWGAF